jgi:hypothetical protein
VVRPPCPALRRRLLWLGRHFAHHRRRRRRAHHRGRRNHGLDTLLDRLEATAQRVAADEEGHEGCRCTNARRHRPQRATLGPLERRTHAHRAVFGEHRAVGALVEAHATLAFVALDESHGVDPGHRRQVVHVLFARAAEANTAAIAGRHRRHLVPIRVAGRCHAKIVEVVENREGLFGARCHAPENAAPADPICAFV